MKLKAHPRRLLLLALAVVGGAAAVAYATAAVTAQTQTIEACQNDTNGLLRVVTAPGDCRIGETAIAWNVQGPPGPAGPAGPPGAGGALAFAHVSADGTLDTSRSSSGVVAVTRMLVTGSTGCGGTCGGFPVYCFELSAQPKSVVATVENSLVDNPPMPPPTPGFEFPARSIQLVAVNATVQPEIAAGWGCSASTDAAVVIGGTGPAGNPFYVEFS